MKLAGAVVRQFSPAPPEHDTVILPEYTILTAFSPKPGVVLWYYQISPDILQVPLAALAELMKRWKRNLAIGEPKPGWEPRRRIPIATPSQDVIDLFEKYLEPQEFDFLEFLPVPFP